MPCYIQLSSVRSVRKVFDVSKLVFLILLAVWCKVNSSFCSSSQHYFARDMEGGCCKRCASLLDKCFGQWGLRWRRVLENDWLQLELIASSSVVGGGTKRCQQGELFTSATRKWRLCEFSKTHNCASYVCRCVWVLMSSCFNIFIDIKQDMWPQM